MESLSSDAIILLALGLFVTGFLVSRGALELMALIMVPIAVGAVLTIKAVFPAELIWLMATAMLGTAAVALRNRPGVNFIVVATGVAVLMLGAKIMLPAAAITRLALSIVFLGVLKFLVF